MEQNYHYVLGANKNADIGKIRHAYRVAAWQYVEHDGDRFLPARPLRACPQNSIGFSDYSEGISSSSPSASMSPISPKRDAIRINASTTSGSN